MIYLLKGPDIDGGVSLDKLAATGGVGNTDHWQAKSIEGGSGAGGEAITPLKIQSPESVVRLVALNDMAIN